MTTKSEIIIYQQDDGNIKIDVRLEDSVVWKFRTTTRYGAIKRLGEDNK